MSRVFVVSFLLWTLSYAVPATTDSANTVFDYVVVGGGTAGLAVASRLSEESCHKVALIEAGLPYELTDPLLRVPAAAGYFIGSSTANINPLVDWGYITTPQAGANGRTLHYTRGKTLGGSSARNTMIYHRGTRGSYKQWADAVDDPSYEFDSFLKYYQKSVKFTPPKSPPRAANATALYDPRSFSSSGGPLHVSYPNYAAPFSSYMQVAFNAIGLKTVKDFNFGSLIGVQYAAKTIDPAHETRDSSETSFLRAASDRPNLTVFTGTLARKVVFNSNKHATGVVVSGATSGTIRAKKEVILSAGAFQSPHLLMLSGVGSAAELRKYNIPVIADRPGVGQNMSDHVFIGGPAYRVNVETNTKLANDPIYFEAQYLTDYSVGKKGPLTNPYPDFLGWEKAPRNQLSATAKAALAQFGDDWPEIEYLSAPAYIGNFSNLSYQPKDGYQYATILAALNGQLSRGTVTLKSGDPLDLPIVNPNWITDLTDAEVAVVAFKRLRQAFTSAPMRPALADTTEYYPGPGVQTDAQILNTIRNSCMPVWHASCTCRMGKRNDRTAVVDSKARVIGVKGLRVVDASSFALLPPGHPQSTVYALAEKISADILAGSHG